MRGAPRKNDKYAEAGNVHGISRGVEIMERKVALIPKVIMKGAMGPKEYGLILTDRRTIFVLEKASKTALLGVLGDALLSDKKQVDYESEDLEKLAADSKSVVVPHADVESIELKSGFSSYTMSKMYTLLLEYKDAEGKRRSVKAFLTPPAGLVDGKKSEGQSKKAVLEEYAKSARKAFEIALPPTVAQKGKWDV